MKIKSVLTNLIRYFILLLVPALVLANEVKPDIQNYCISKSEKKSLQKQKSPEVVINVRNQTFKAVAENGSVSLYDVRNIRLDTVYTNEYVDVPHEHLDIVLSKNGWLWIDGYVEDNFVHINLNLESPKFEKIHRLPNLYRHPYSFLKLALTRQYRNETYYSHTLDRIFITGYPASWFGFSKPVAYEIVSGKVKRLPNELAMARFLGEGFGNNLSQITDKDYSSLGGALFENATGQLVFYDGKNVKAVLGRYKNKQAKKDIFGRLKSKGEIQWRTHFIKGSKRILLEAISDKKIDIYELNQGVKLNLLITVDKNDKHKLAMVGRFFSLPNSRHLWTLNVAPGSDDNRSLMLFNEADKKFHTKLTIKRPWLFTFGDVIDNGMQIELCNPVLGKCNDMSKYNKNWRYYFLSDKSTSKLECFGTFGINKSFVLDPEASN